MNKVMEIYKKAVALLCALALAAGMLPAQLAVAFVPAAFAESVPVTGVSLSSTELALTVGATGGLTATVEPAEATDQTVTWSSDKPEIATVDAHGGVTAVSAGTATITATATNGTPEDTSDDKTAACTVTVGVPAPVPVAVTGVALDLNETELAVGEEKALTATVSPESATDKTVTWSSDKPEIATVDAAGKVCAVAQGTAVITATATNGTPGDANDDKTAVCTVTVRNVEAQSISLDQTTAAMTVGGGTLKLTATVEPQNTTDATVSWSSDKETVATVTDGVVTAVGNGEAIITATTSNGITAACTVSVTTPADGVLVVPPQAELIVNGSGEEKSIQLTATVSPESASDKAVTWSSDNPDVATVDAAGNVTAVGVGTAAVTATAANGTPEDTSDDKTATCMVTVKQRVAIQSITPVAGKGKFYDGSTSIPAENFTVTLDEAAAQAGVTISGLAFFTPAADAGTHTLLISAENAFLSEGYVLDENSLPTNLEYEIQQRPVTLQAVTFTDKTYDGTTAVAAGSAGYTFTEGDAVGADVLMVAGLTFETGKDAGEGQTVTVAGVDQAVLKLKDGSAAQNYRFAAAEGQTQAQALREQLDKLTMTVTVQPYELTVALSGSLDKNSDGDATITAAPDTLVFTANAPEAVGETLKITANKVTQWRYENLLPGEWPVTGMRAEDFTFAGDSKSNYTIGWEEGSFQGTITANAVENADLDLTESADGVFELRGDPQQTVSFAPAGHADADEKRWFGGTETLQLAAEETAQLLNADNTSFTLPSMMESAEAVTQDFYVKTENNVVYGPVRLRYADDKTAPTIVVEEVKALRFSNKELEYTITVTDENGSGVDQNALCYFVGKNADDHGESIKEGWKIPQDIKREKNSYTFTVTAPATGYLYVRVADHAGNLKYLDHFCALVIEEKAPELTLTCGDAGTPLNSHTVQIGIRDAEEDGTAPYEYSGIAGYTYQLTPENSKEAVAFGDETYPSPTEMANIPALREVQSSQAFQELDGLTLNGKYVLTVTARDFCGNATTESITLVFDNTAPKITVEMTAGNEVKGTYYYNANNCGITVTFQDDYLSAGGEYKVELTGPNESFSKTYRLDNIEAGSTETSVEISAADLADAGVLDGTYTITVTATDLAGNAAAGFTGSKGVQVAQEAPTTATFILDKTPPKLTKVASTQNNYYGGTAENAAYYHDTFTLTFTVEEANYNIVDGTMVAMEICGPQDAQTEIKTVKGETDEAGRVDIEMTVTPKKEAQIPHEEYTFALAVTDPAGNQLVCDEEYQHESYDAVTCAAGKAETNTVRILDNVAPQAELRFTERPTTYCYQEGDYYNNSFEAEYIFTDLQNGLLLDRYVVAHKGPDNKTTILQGSLEEGNRAIFKYEVKAEAENNGSHGFYAYGTDKAGNALTVVEYASNEKYIADASGSEKTTSAGHKEEQNQHRSKTKILDTLSPVVEVTYTALEDTHYYNEGTEEAPVFTAYYNNDIVTDFAFTDNIGLDESKLHWSRSKDGEIEQADTAFGQEKAAGNNKKEFSKTIEEDGHYRYIVYGEDKAGNALTVTEHTTEKNGVSVTEDKGHNAEKPYIGFTKALDTAAPTVTIDYTSLDDRHYYDENGGTAYYNGAFETTFSFTDGVNGLDLSKLSAGRTLDGAPDATLDISSNYITDTVAANAQNGHYRYTVCGEDKAGNALTVTENKTKNESTPVTEDKGHHVNAPYTGHHKVLDTVSPTVELRLETDAANPALRRGDGNDRYYFNKAFTASFVLEETNFDANKVTASYGYNGTAVNYQTDGVDRRGGLLAGTGPTSENGDTHTYSAAYSADGVYGFALDGEDRAGNPVVLKTPLASNATLQSYSAEQWGVGSPDRRGKADSYLVAVDTVAPKLTVTLDDFYRAVLSEGSVYNVQLNHPYQKRIAATAGFAGDDCSPLSMAYEIVSTVGGQSASLDNGDSYTYQNTQSAQFNAQQTIYLSKLAVTDLAGNASTLSAPGNKIYLDTTAPTNDQLAPTVTMTATAKGDGRGPNGNPLFASDVTVNAQLTDPGEGVSASGLYQVYYRVTVNGEEWNDRVRVASGAGGSNNGAGVIRYQASGSTYSENAAATDETLTCQDSINFTFDANTFNYNDVKIYVWAEDNSGNRIEEGNAAYYYFGIDVTAPTIRVSYDNNDVQNEKYFKADRTATIVVTERNFDVNSTVITTQSQAGISAWSYAAGKMPNGDDDTWTCEVRYSTDGDYTFDVTTADLLGHHAGSPDYGTSVAATEFVLDKTAPVIELSFDNNDVRNGKYYKDPRAATILITEHNFSADGATVSTTAAIAEGTVAAPGVGGWARSGDANTATVSFGADGDYTMRVEYTDLAGNEAEVKTVEEFTVDTTAPQLEFSGVQDHSANKGAVAPVITYHDINYDPAGTNVSITGYKNTAGSNLNGVAAEDAMGGSFTCENIAETPENDDVYTCLGTVSDLAGNTTEDTILFSVNRYGSNYILDTQTASLMEDYYTNQAPTLRVTEINVDTLEKGSVSYAVSGETVTLTEGEDYDVQASGSETTWKQYDYTIHAGNFAREGVYDVTIYSEDAAGNANTNRTSREATYAKTLSFVLDATAPTLVVTGVEEEGSYNANERTILVTYDENFAMGGLTITNGVKTETYTAQQLQAQSGSIEFITEASNSRQAVTATAVDMAGNSNSVTSPTFLLTTNPFIRFINNTPLLIGSGIGLLAVALAVFSYARKGFLFALLHRKKVTQK